jgi:hypothetical protein
LFQAAGGRFEFDRKSIKPLMELLRRELASLRQSEI